MLRLVILTFLLIFSSISSAKVVDLSAADSQSLNRILIELGAYVAFNQNEQTTSAWSIHATESREGSGFAEHSVDIALLTSANRYRDIHVSGSRADRIFGILKRARLRVRTEKDGKSIETQLVVCTKNSDGTFCEIVQ